MKNPIITTKELFATKEGAWIKIYSKGFDPNQKDKHGNLVWTEEEIKKNKSWFEPFLVHTMHITSTIEDTRLKMENLEWFKNKN